MKSGLTLACPITTQVKGYPFEVEFTAGKVHGVILADQIRAVDWKQRGAKKIDAVSEAVVKEVQEYLEKLILE